MDIEKIWSEWSNKHDTEDQQKRIKNSITAALTPIVIDHNHACGVFQGRHGRYNTTLSDCSCLDFLRRQLPCKHMYRLASELGILDTDVEKYLHGGYSWKVAIELIEQYPINVQQEFYMHFMSRCKSSAPYRRKKSLELDLLIADGIISEYPDKETKCFKVISLIPDFLVDRQKLHYYFSRKLYPPTYLDPDGMVPVKLPLPEDDVTDFLRERGFVE